MYSILYSVAQNYNTPMKVTQYHSLFTIASINDCISIDIVLEQRCAKFI